MKKLSPADKDVILEAAERVFNEGDRRPAFSCHEILKSKDENDWITGAYLVDAYVAFYEKQDVALVSWGSIFPTNRENRLFRTLLLLNFREACR